MREGCSQESQPAEQTLQEHREASTGCLQAPGSSSASVPLPLRARSPILSQAPIIQYLVWGTVSPAY